MGHTYLYICSTRERGTPTCTPAAPGSGAHLPVHLQHQGAGHTYLYICSTRERGTPTCTSAAPGSGAHLPVHLQHQGVGHTYLYICSTRDGAHLPVYLQHQGAGHTYLYICSTREWGTPTCTSAAPGNRAHVPVDLQHQGVGQPAVARGVGLQQERAHKLDERGGVQATNQKLHQLLAHTLLKLLHRCF